MFMSDIKKIMLAAAFFIAASLAGAASPSAAADARLSVESVRCVLESAGGGDYVIGAGDLVKVFVYENPEYSDSYRIGPDGKMSMPIIGTIEAAGHDREGLSSIIRERLARYIASPIVSVIVSEYNNNFVYILGEVANPGRHDFRNEMTFLSVLPQAGLSGALAARKMKCDIIRRGAAVFTIDLSDHDAVLQNRILLNLKLASGDVLYFSEADRIKDSVYVLGAVKNPGVFAFDKKEGLSKLLKDKVEMKGRTAKLLKIIRRSPERVIELEYNLSRPDSKNPAIESGDMIYVQDARGGDFSYCVKQIAPYAAVSLIGAEAVRMARDK